MLDAGAQEISPGLSQARLALLCRVSLYDGRRCLLCVLLEGERQVHTLLTLLTLHHVPHPGIFAKDSASAPRRSAGPSRFPANPQSCN